MKPWYAIFLIPVIFFSAAALLSQYPVCGNDIAEGIYPTYFYEECDDGNRISGDGCSAECLLEFPEKIYVAPYMGNMEGGFSEEWFYFYDRLINFFETEHISVGATTYPASILEKPEFAPYAKRLYESDYIELVQKANTGLGEELRMDSLSYDGQKKIIKQGQDTFRESMAQILDIPEGDVKLPFAYNQPQGRFTNVTRQVIEDLGFKMFFEMYFNVDMDPVRSSETVDVLQYGVGFTIEGAPGRKTAFYQPREILEELREINKTDVYMLDMNGDRIVPIWVHHMDFEHRNQHNVVDRIKWDIYIYVMRRINQEPNLKFVSPTEIWYLRH